VALIVVERAVGTLAYPILLLAPGVVPNSDEGTDTSTGAVPVDHFTSNWYQALDASRQGVHAGEAVAMLAIFDQAAQPPVPLAIIDRGFASPADWNGYSSPDYGMPYNSIPQCDVGGSPSNCSPGSAAGKNPVNCNFTNPCPWHGTEMYGVAGGALDNGYGAAGIGSGVVSPIF
jgi:hypothetical protein